MADRFLTIDDIELPTRTHNVLLRAGLVRLLDISCRTRDELLAVRNMRPIDVELIRHAMEKIKYDPESEAGLIVQDENEGRYRIPAADRSCFAEIFPAEVANELKARGLRDKDDFRAVPLSELSRIPGVTLEFLKIIQDALSCDDEE